MNFQAEPVTINTLLSVSKQYFIPRYQREFSWGKEQIEELWTDLIDNIKFENGVMSCEEYFIGTLVLAGSDESFEVEIVDGQQRLTVITMLISAICRALAEAGKTEPATSTFNTFIKGVNRRGDAFKKLDKRSRTNYFSLLIQDLEQHECIPETQEDSRVFDAYRVISGLLSKASIAKDIYQLPAISDEQYVDALFTVIDLMADHLKVIRVNVTDQDEAYVIFEILNARGINLGPVDLIKNKVLAEWDNQYPIDFAKEKWDEIASRLNDRDVQIGLEDYAIHHWTTRFPYTSKRNLYKSFRKRWLKNELSPREYLEDLHSCSEVYVKLISPQIDDWPQLDQRPIFNSLSALDTFNVSINRSFLLSLFIAREKNRISQAQQIVVLRAIETFHFMFNAICSMRPSGIEGTYAKYSRLLSSAENRRTALAVINELLEKLRERLPDEASFTTKFSQLQFTNKQASHKKLVQYILVRFEMHARRGANELMPDSMTIEHISSQAGLGVSMLGSIGNLLPLGAQLNERADRSPFQRKLQVYAGSEYQVVSRFIEANREKTEWLDQDIVNRARDMALQAYREIWVFPAGPAL